MRILLAVAVVMILAPDGNAKSLRRQCRIQCRDEITACVAAGGKRRRCRRQILRRCRQEGLTICLPAGSPAPSTTTTTQAGGTSTTTTPAGGTTTTTMLSMVNGCERATSVDLRGQSQVTVAFGVNGSLTYEPACFTVSPGTTVTFQGDFAFHPLRGGTVTDGVPVPDPASPFEPVTNSGGTKTFTLSQPGVSPFYCQRHADFGMTGAAFVVP